MMRNHPQPPAVFSTALRLTAKGDVVQPEPSLARFTALKQAVAEGRAPRKDLDFQIGVYSDFFAWHPELLNGKRRERSWT